MKVLDTKENLDKILKKEKTNWPHNVSHLALSPWNSLHFEYGLQPWFHDSRETYDSDSNVNGCFNILPSFFCGNKTKKLMIH